MSKTFIYNGMKFQPAGRFKDYGIKDIWNPREANQHIDYNKVVANINYDEFYKAAGGKNKNTDVFKTEKGQLCVPCNDQLLSFNASADEFKKLCHQHFENLTKDIRITK